MSGNIFAEIRKNLNEGVQTKPTEGKPDEVNNTNTQPINEGEEGVVYEELKFEGDELTLNVCSECGAVMENEQVCSECGGECNEAYKMVVRNGKVKKVRVQNKKRKMTSKQKSALAKARRKAHSGSAQKARAKSMKVRHAKKVEGETFECPECGYIGDMKFDKKEDAYVCPDCGAFLDIDDEANKAKENNKGEKPAKNEGLSDEVQVYVDALEINESIVAQGEDAVRDFLNETYGIKVK